MAQKPWIFIAAVIVLSIMGVSAILVSRLSNVAWNGYVAETNFSNPLPQVSAVNGSWIVPTLYPGFLNRILKYSWDSKEWVGIGGYDGPTIVQLGTETSYYGKNGTVVYYAWYEYFNKSANTTNTINNKKIIRNLTIKPGDIIYASVRCISNCSSTPQRWSIYLNDTTRDESFRNISTFNSVGISADWIVELEPKVDLVSSLILKRTPSYFGPIYTHMGSDYASINGITVPLGSLNHKMIQQLPTVSVTNLANSTSFAVN